MHLPLRKLLEVTMEASEQNINIGEDERKI